MSRMPYFKLSVNQATAQTRTAGVTIESDFFGEKAGPKKAMITCETVKDLIDFMQLLQMMSGIANTKEKAKERLRFSPSNIIRNHLQQRGFTSATEEQLNRSNFSQWVTCNINTGKLDEFCAPFDKEKDVKFYLFDISKSDAVLILWK